MYNKSVARNSIRSSFLWKCDNNQILTSLKYLSSGNNVLHCRIQIVTRDMQIIDVPISGISGDYAFCIPRGMNFLSVIEVNQPLALRIDVEEFEEYPLHIALNGTGLYPFTNQLTLSDHSSWLIMQSEVPSDWYLPNFNDTLWLQNPDLVDSPSVYFRSSALQIPSGAKMMIIKVVYEGGLNVFFNGDHVAQFNLPNNSTFTTEGEASQLTKDFFSVPLLVNSPRTTFVLAMELHRCTNGSLHNFHIQGFFVYEDPPHIAASFSGSINGYPFDNEDDMVTGNNFVNVIFTSVSRNIPVKMEFRNRAPVAVDSIEFLTSTSLTLESIDVKGWDDEEYIHISMEDTPPISSFHRLSVVFNMWSPSSRLRIGHFFYSTRYYHHNSCKSPSNSLTIPFNTSALSPCPVGRYGAASQVCTSGLQESLQFCHYYPPESFSYDPSEYMFRVNVPARTMPPCPEPTVTYYQLFPRVVLPAGLTLDRSTGVISGTPKEAVARRVYSIGGGNPDSQIMASSAITLTVLQWACLDERMMLHEIRYETEKRDDCIRIFLVKKCLIDDDGMGYVNIIRSFCLTTTWIITILILFISVVCLIVVIILVCKRRKHQLKVSFNKYNRCHK